MRIAYFDCSSGLAGDMILAALIDAGAPFDRIKKELKALPVNRYALRVTKVDRGALRCRQFQVKTRSETRHRSLSDVLKLIRGSGISKGAKELSSRIFTRLGRAEASVHGIPIDQVHFHEVGAVDAIIDIVGTAIALEKLGIEKVYCSPIPFGKGKIKHAHGILPNPAPAAAELLKGAPIYQENVRGELVTPTGAAIMTTIAESFGDLPRLRLQAIGRGAGSKIYPNLPGFVTVYLGEAWTGRAHRAAIRGLGRVRKKLK